MQQGFANKVVVITGAGGGIGQAIALRYATAGAKVVVNDIKAGLVETVVAEIRSKGGLVLGAAGDVSNKSFVDSLFERTEETFGCVDVLINNAAIIGDQRHFLNADEAWWDKFLNVNLKSAFLCTHRAARVMVRRRKGVVINVSSGGGSRSHRGHVAYDSSKGGLEAFTRGVALDLAPYGVRVNTLVPGLINTYGLEGEDLREREQVVPLGRYGVAEDLVGAAMFLTSDEASYMTGQMIVIDGGVLAQQRSANVDTFPLSGFPKIEADLP